MNTFIKQIIFLIICGFYQITNCQSGNYRFDHINSRNGLSHNSVLSILKDSKGFMWFGTYGGLNRYDGYNMISYRTERGKANSLQSNSLTTLFEDHEGNIWIGTYGGGLFKYDPALEKFTQYKYLHLQAGSNIIPKVSSICEDGASVLWIGTSEGLDRFDRKEGKFYNYRFKSDIHADNNITVVYKGSSSNLWIGTYLGLKLFNRETGSFICFNHDSSNVNSLSHRFVYSIYEDLSGIVWVGTGGGGLDRFDTKTGVFTHNVNDPKNSKSISNNVVWVVEPYSQDRLLVGTELGINIFNKDTRSFERIKNDPKDPQSLSNDIVRCIYQDNCGLIWVGTDGGGINKMDIYTKKFHVYQSENYNTNSLSNNNIFSIHEGQSDLIWIGTIDGGLNSFDPGTKQFKHLVHDQKNPNSISSNKILSLEVGPSGNLWIGTDRDGLCMLSKNSKNLQQDHARFLVYRPDPANPNTLNSDIIYSVLEDKTGTVWAGTWGRGLNKLTFNKVLKDNTIDYSHPEIVHYRTNLKDINSISSDIIFKLYEDREGTIWIGTSGGGLNKLVVSKKEVDGKTSVTDEFISYKFNEDDSSSLSDNNVCSIYESKKGDFWIGTVVGLNKMDREKGTFKVYTTRDGLPNNVVYGILEDKKGNLWLGTQGGIGKFDPVNEKFRNYTREDGIADNVFNPSAFCQTKSGKMFFGGTYGMTSFFPDSITDNPFSPQVMITDFRILNKLVKIGKTKGNREILKSSISRASEISLNYKDYVMSFEFSASNFSNPLKNLYAFKMEGFDNDWVYTGANNRDATYTNLDPGLYVFRVKASNCDGIWNDMGTSILVTIAPPYWKTWWFRIIIIVFLSLVLYGIYLLKVHEMKNQKILLESIVKKRTHILEQNQELEQHRWNLEELVTERTTELEKAKNKAEQSDRLKTAFLANMSHEIRTPLNAIVGFSSLLSDSKLKEEEKLEYQKQINHNTESLLLLIDDIIDLSKIESGLLEINKEKFSVNKLLDDIYSYWMIHNAKRGLTVKFSNKEKDADIFVYSDKFRIKQIITNLMSNAIKFTEKGYVELGFETKENNYLFFVRDTGIGIAAENLDFIFKRFRKVEDNKTILYRGIGLGLAISKSIAGMLGGKLFVESKHGVGSTFFFELPVSIIEEPKIKKTEPEIPFQDDYNWKDKHILIVEDNDASYLFLNRVLKRTNASTDWASNGNAAVDYFRSGKTYDLVLMDIRLPGINGIQALKLIREIKPDQKIIAQTAYASIENEEEIIKAGFDGYLTKPTNVKLLLFKINEVFNV